MTTADRAIRPLAQDHIEVCRSPDPQHIYCYTPAIIRLPSGRLLASCDWGGSAEHMRALDGPLCEHWRSFQGRVYTSDDEGATWQLRHCFPFYHARPFLSDGACHIIGQAGDLQIMRCEDGEGEQWSDPIALTEGQDWHQGASNVLHANGCIYLIMERAITNDIVGWDVGEKAPVTMRVPEGSDLLQREAWTFASELSFRDIIPGIEGDDPQMDWHGLPWFSTPYPRGSDVAPDRHANPMGWLESHILQISDPDHQLHDPSGRSLFIVARAHTCMTNYACLARVVEDEPGSGAMRTELIRSPAGKTLLYVPFPGGQMKFHVCYDETTKLYWLCSTQSTDSMCRPDRLPAHRYGLPDNERRRLALHFSKNLIDWCFAGLIAVGETANASRHYANMVIDGDDLLVLSRSGDEDARSAHDGNMITFHRITDFRDLVY